MIIQDLKNLTENTVPFGLTDSLCVKEILFVGDRMVTWITIEDCVRFLNE